MEFNKSFFQQKLKSGIEFFNKNKLNEAIECFKILQNERSTQIIAFLYLGIIEIKKNNNENAKKYFFKILEIDKNHEFANLNLGLISFQEKDMKKTLDYLNKTLDINQDNLLANYHLGLIEIINKEYEKAKKRFKNILLKEPKNLNALNNLGICYLKEINFKKAITIFKECLNINNNHKQSILNLANCFFQIRDFENSILNYNKVLGIDKDHTMAKIGLSKCYFAKYDYKKGFLFYESRKKIQIKNLNIIKELTDRYGCNEWLGEDLDNKKILILSEQGIGDNIQFARYLFELKENFNVNIFFLAGKKIAHLFKDCPCEIITDISEIKKIHYYQFLLSLPGIYFDKKNNFKKCVNFIKPESNNENKWFQRLRNLKKPLIAIHWKGNKNFSDYHERMIPLKFFDKIVKNKKYSFLTVQKDDFPSDIQKNFFQDYIIDYSKEVDLNDKSFEDTISILKNIDLLITSDTSMVHLAGTMEVETLLILNMNPDWRWQIELKEKCFYKKLKIIQQNKLFDWSNIPESINRELEYRFK